MKKLIKKRMKGLLHVTAVVAICAMAGAMAASCDSHEAVDLRHHVGYVLCSDHSCVSYEEYKSLDPGRKAAVGVVFAEATSSHPTLVVSLDEYSEAFCDSVGMVNGTSCAVDTCDGYSNTVAMYGCYVQASQKGCPIAMRCFDTHYYGQSQYVPSVYEMRLLTAAAPAVNAVIEELGGKPVQTSGDCWYWTSTEVAGNPGYQAWLCSAAPNAGIQETPKTESHKVRPILQLNYPSLNH